MTVCHIHISSPPEDVFAVLADARSFAYWVVGAKSIRGTDGDWPSEGAVFHHTVGVGPIKLKDHTRVLECRPPNRLVLEAVAGPLGSARVMLELRPEKGGTGVRMEELPLRGLVTLIPRFLLEFPTRIRNERSLDRLKRAVEKDGPVAA